MESKRKINWKVRFKNKIWLGSFLSLIIGFIFKILQAFDVYPEVMESEVVLTVDNILTFLGLVGVLIDPTTEGMFDSERALSYDEPWNDKTANQDDEGATEIVDHDSETDEG